MAEIKLTKTELRSQQGRLQQLLKYLPTLQLKKALLQAEVAEVRQEIAALQNERVPIQQKVDVSAPLLSQHLSYDISRFTRVQEVKKRVENIAGTDVPIFETCTFAPLTYDLFDTPIWFEGVISELRHLVESSAKIAVARERLRAIEHELREVSIRVNLFEKILIPRAQRNIKKIKIFLGDQSLAAVAQAKVAKAKILAKYAERRGEPQKEYVA